MEKSSVESVESFESTLKHQFLQSAAGAPELFFTASRHCRAFCSAAVKVSSNSWRVGNFQVKTKEHLKKSHKNQVPILKGPKFQILKVLKLQKSLKEITGSERSVKKRKHRNVLCLSTGSLQQLLQEVQDFPALLRLHLDKKSTKSHRKVTVQYLFLDLCIIIYCIYAFNLFFCCVYLCVS